MGDICLYTCVDVVVVILCLDLPYDIERPTSMNSTSSPFARSVTMVSISYEMFSVCLGLCLDDDARRVN